MTANLVLQFSYKFSKVTHAETILDANISKMQSALVKEILPDLDHQDASKYGT